MWHAVDMGLGDGDGFVKCAWGHWHWGVHGAAGLLVHHPHRGVLLQRRAWWVHHGRTWSLPGGAVHSDETPAQAATREAAEEADLDEDLLRPVAEVVEDHHTWRYTTVLAVADGRLRARAVSSESAELRWVGRQDVERFALHHDFAAAWPTLAEQLGRELVVIIDTATVAAGDAHDGAWPTGPVPGEALELPSLGQGTRPWSWWPRVVRRRGRTAVLAALEDVRSSDQGHHIDTAVVTADHKLRARAAAAGAATPDPAALLGAGVQTWAPSSGP